MGQTPERVSSSYPVENALLKAYVFPGDNVSLQSVSGYISKVTPRHYLMCLSLKTTGKLYIQKNSESIDFETKTTGFKTLSYKTNTEVKHCPVGQAKKPQT